LAGPPPVTQRPGAGSEHSQASPTPLPLESDWSGSAISGQTSNGSAMPSPSLSGSGVPVQTPAEQMSSEVISSPSLQVAPSGWVGLLQRPDDGLQTPAAWHWSEAAHVIGLEPTHVPRWQVSVSVHVLPSLQGEPSGDFLGLEHLPFAGLQVPATWHWSGAVQVTGLEPTQIPFWHVSVCVQASPSSQTVPLALSGLVHAPLSGSQIASS